MTERRAPEDLSIRDAKERWLDRRRTGSSEKTVQSYHYRLKRIETIETYYDEATERQRLEERRRPFVSRLSLNPEESTASDAGEAKPEAPEIDTHDAN